MNRPCIYTEVDTDIIHKHVLILQTCIHRHGCCFYASTWGHRCNIWTDEFELGSDMHLFNRHNNIIIHIHTLGSYIHLFYIVTSTDMIVDVFTLLILHTVIVSIFVHDDVDEAARGWGLHYYRTHCCYCTIQSLRHPSFLLQTGYSILEVAS